MTLSIQNQRVIYGDNGTLTDNSVGVNDYNSGSMSFSYVATEDYIYIGSELPFNHKYIAMDSDNLNDQAASLAVDIWFSNAWVAAVDVIDRTEISGVPLAQDGIIQWNTNRLKGWDRELDSADVTGLSGTVIYNKYWVRLSYSANLAAPTAIKYIGYKFADDDDLYDEYPELSNSALKTRFESGKTTWDDQHYVAAKEIIKDLKAAGIIKSASQLLDFEIFRSASVHKAAEIIYRGMGANQEDKRKTARQHYKDALNVKYFRVDLDADGSLDDYEKRQSVGFMRR